MKSSKLPQEPTKSELEILQVLWELGPSSARQVNDHINRHRREVMYMSTLKLMQIMVEKGFLEKDESRMTHIYRALAEEKKTKTQLLDKMVETLFNGSAGSLMMHLLDGKKLSPQEIEEYKALLDDTPQARRTNGGPQGGRKNK